jgi:hypothetical protein
VASDNFEAIGGHCGRNGFQSDGLVNRAHPNRHEKAKGGGDHQSKDHKKPPVSGGGAPTLKDLGISSQQASDWQRMASLSQPQFEEVIGAMDRTGRPPSTKGIVRAADCYRRFGLG